MTPGTGKSPLLLSENLSLSSHDLHYPAPNAYLSTQSQPSNTSRTKSRSP